MELNIGCLHDVLIKVGHIDAMGVWWNLETFDRKSSLYIAKKKLKGFCFHTHMVFLFLYNSRQI